MKKIFPKIVALMVAISTLASLAGCNSKKEEEVVEHQYPFEIQKLPSEEYDVDEVHPEHKPGKLSGKKAVAELNAVELELIQSEFTCYLDATLMYEDYEALGIEYEDYTIGTFDYSKVTEEDVEPYLAMLDRLYDIDYESLDESDRVCYDKLVYDLEDTVYCMQFTEFPYFVAATNSFTGIQSDIFFVLDVIPFETVEDAENYIEMLESFEDYFGDLCSFEEKRVKKGYALSDDNYEAIAESFDNLVAQEDDCFLYESFEERLDDIDGLKDKKREELIEAHEDAMKTYVFPTFEDCADRMRDLKGNCTNELGLYYYDGGLDYYAMVVRDKSNSELTPEDIIDIFDDEMDALIEMMFTGNYSMGYSISVGDVQENLDYLYGEIFEYFPELPKHKYTLREVPEVYAENFSPAAYLAYHVDSFDSNLIITNPSSDDDTLGPTLAHEGYPGHMYQSIYTRSITDHPYMYLNTPSGYAEGWAFYVELFSTDLFDLTEKDKNAYYIDAMLNVVFMGRIDVGVNYEGWDAQDAADYMNEKFGMDLYSADAFQEIVDICVVDPGYPLPYALGYYNTNKIISGIIVDNPDMDLVDVFELYLGAQTGRFEQIEASVERQLDED